MTSTHKVEVVPLEKEAHPNADKLKIVKVHGYTVVINESDWEGKDRAGYLPPDSLAPISRPEFDWLTKTTNTFYNENCVKVEPDYPGEKYVRVTAKRLRKVLSYGLMAPIPADIPFGTDVAEALGVKHYNPPESQEEGSASISAPSGIHTTRYDVESFQYYAEKVFIPGESVFISEKIHGGNGRCVFTNGEIHAGSRGQWNSEYPVGGGNRTLPWAALRNTPGVIEWLKEHPDYVLYGEIYGRQNLKYGLQNGEVKFIVFDIQYKGEWINILEAKEMSRDLPWCPEIAQMPFDFNKILGMAEGPSLIPGANHFREGIVIKPLKERVDSSAGRVQLKLISESYHAKC